MRLPVGLSIGQTGGPELERTGRAIDYTFVSRRIAATFDWIRVKLHADAARLVRVC
jgi:hypothetical protein